jgi:Protein of unknown function (DUF1573)
MRPVPVLAAIFAAVVSMYVVVWWLHYEAPPPPLPQETANTQGEAGPARMKLDPRPVIAPKGPYPKVAIDKTELEFGRMEVHQKSTHSFTVRNEGEAPLVLTQGPSNCQCTISNLTKRSIDPGESAEVTIEWQAVSQVEQFLKEAEIYTNDPERQSIKLSIIGGVSPRLIVLPEKDWVITNLQEGDAPTAIEGLIASPLNADFQVVAVECESPFVKTSVAPLTEVEREQFQGRHGFKIIANFEPGMPVGSFRYPVKIRTNLLERKTNGELGDTYMEPTIYITGNRVGPFRLMGPEWNERYGSISLGSFAASKGKTVSLPLLVRGAPEEGIKFNVEGCDPDFVKVEFVPDLRFASSAKKFTLKVSYPPGSPRMIRRDETAGTIKISTNHPNASEIVFKLYFTAY